jgi:bile acid:Na+ symporter, BASS family
MLHTYYDKLSHLDDILKFSPTGLMIMNITIAFVMFGVALGIRKEHFQNIVQSPKIIITGLIGHYIVMPGLSFLLVIVAKLPVPISLGILLVASCPGGNISNFITSVARGNVAVSVTLTAISDLLSILMTPITFTFLGNLYLDTLPLQHPIHIPFSEVLQTIFLLMGVPLALGLAFKKKFPETTKKIYKPLKTASFIIFLLMVVAMIFTNRVAFSKYILLLLPIVFVHNFMALSSGYFTAWTAKLSHLNRKTISIEVGIQNSGIALVLFFNNQIFPPGYQGVAYICAMWGIWHIVAGLTIASIWSFQKDKPEKVPAAVEAPSDTNPVDQVPDK